MAALPSACGRGAERVCDMLLQLLPPRVFKFRDEAILMLRHMGGLLSDIGIANVAGVWSAGALTVLTRARRSCSADLPGVRFWVPQRELSNWEITLLGNSGGSEE